MKSFAIATTDVTDVVLQYWQNQYSSYQTGDAMNVAYNTFMTALLVEYVHDRIADNIAAQLNVIWSRTSPVIVSVGEDPYQIYETLECDHSMGMTVIGTVENIRIFNYVTSFSIPYMEYVLMSSAYNSTFSSVPIELNYLYNNYENMYVKTFQYNGFIITKSIFNSFLVFDPETGIVRDIDTVNNLYGGIYELGGSTTDFGKLYFFKQSTTMISYITLIGFRFYVWQISNPWDLGTYQFNWDRKGNVFISSSGNSLANIMADTILTITGPNGEKTVKGTQGALDITDILNINAELQTLHLVLQDTDGGFIATSALYIVESSIERQDLELPPLFPTPNPTWPPSPIPPFPSNNSNPPSNPFPPFPWPEVPGNNTNPFPNNNGEITLINTTLPNGEPFIVIFNIKQFAPITFR